MVPGHEISTPTIGVVRLIHCAQRSLHLPNLILLVQQEPGEDDAEALIHHERLVAVEKTR